MLLQVIRLFILFSIIVAGASGWLRVGIQAQGNSLQGIATLPELPRIFLDSTYIKPRGRIFNVASGAKLQEAIQVAKPGDVILLRPGGIYIGNFVLPAKPVESTSSDEWIVIRSAASDSCLPQPGNRIRPEYADLLPKIISPNDRAAIETEDGAHHYRLIGLEITVGGDQLYSNNLLKLGEGGSRQSSTDTVAHDLIVDRCYIHGNTAGQVVRGIALNSARTSIIDSYISEIHGVGFDTQAICGWNGPGPFKIANNYLEASGENVMFGGADPFIAGLIPSDIEFRNNHLYKPLRWKVGSPEYAGVHWTVKNSLELKNSQRILIEGNVIENNWVDAQDGFALVFKSVNQDGTAPWSVTRDVIFLNNIVRNSDAGLNLLGRDTSHVTDLMVRVLVRNNFWENIGNGNFGSGAGRFLQMSEVPDVTVDHNTVLHSGLVLSAYGETSPNLVYTNNISSHNEYGVKGDGAGTGNDTIKTYFPNAVFTGNVLAGGLSSDYPANNFFPATMNDVKFVSPSDGIYRLEAFSPYFRAGGDGKDLGCDFDVLGKVIAKTVANNFFVRSSLIPRSDVAGCK